MRPFVHAFSRIRPRWAATLPALLIGLGACGDDDPNDGLISGTGPEAAASYGDYVQLLNDAYCDSYVACCGQQLSLTQDACIADLNASDEDGDEAQAAIAAGRARLDANAARRCASVIRNAACTDGDSVFEPNSGCFDWALGTVPNGGRCLIRPECADGLCVFETEEATEGVCTATPVGEPCRLTCNTYRDGERDCYETCARSLVCQNGTCVVPTPRPTVGQPCNADGRCAWGAWCNDANLCEAERPAGAPCNDGDACESSECVRGVCAEIDYCF